MIIKKIAFGNSEESFIETSLSDDFNIISSDDNNKGKTIVIQSLMYALGNEPTFPSSFQYKEYFYFVEIEIKTNIYKICRKSNGFVLKTTSSLMIFDNVSEFKRYWDKNIFRLPHIYKNDILRIADPILYLQLFFVGQDKKDTYNISNSGYYNKKDFNNMLFDFCNLGSQLPNPEEIQVARKSIIDLKDERKTLIEQNKLLASPKTAANYLSSISDKNTFEQKIKTLNKINNKIAELRKERNLSATRKARWETTAKELRSLNRTLDIGELKCMDCGSTNISFSTSKKEAFNFDVSSANMRSEILNSIAEKIDAYEEEIQKNTSLINNQQDKLNLTMADNDISLETIIAYKNEATTGADADKRVREIDSQINELNDQINSSYNNSTHLKTQQTQLLISVISLIKKIYITIDPNSNAIIEGLFTKKDEVLSGSEATIFHLAKIYAIQKCTNHDFPIIIDSFRAEDLSSTKEEIVLNLFNELENQKIFTTTLKLEEVKKYDNIPYLNSIDYADHTPSKILDKKFNLEFEKLLSDLSIQLN